MSASSRIKIIIPLVSAMSLLAVPAQAQDARPPRDAAQPSAGPGAGAPPQNMRKGPPPQQAARPAPQPGGQPHAGGPPGPGPRPARSCAAQCRRPAARTQLRQGSRTGARLGRTRLSRPSRLGWRTLAPRSPQRPLRLVVGCRRRLVLLSAADGRARRPTSPRITSTTCRWPTLPPPPVAYEPPPPPPPADPGASALGGAIVGGVLGGLISGNASGAAAGAVIGGATGAIAGATAASRPGYYFAQGNCYYRYPSGQYVQADPRACY